MSKLVELKAMADSVGLAVDLEKTDDREVYRLYKDGKEIAKGSYDVIKIKLEDLIDMESLEGKIKEMIDAGKTDEEIVKILSEEKLLKSGLSFKDELIKKWKKFKEMSPSYLAYVLDMPYELANLIQTVAITEIKQSDIEHWAEEYQNRMKREL